MTVQLDPNYVEDVVRMGEAAERWLAEHGREGIRFSVPPREWMVIVPLSSSVAMALLADSELSWTLLRVMNGAAEGRGTLFQAGIVIRELGLPHEEWSDEKIARLLKAAGGVS